MDSNDDIEHLIGHLRNYLQELVPLILGIQTISEDSQTSSTFKNFCENNINFLLLYQTPNQDLIEGL
jgi:hypothetical protein